LVYGVVYWLIWSRHAVGQMESRVPMGMHVLFKADMFSSRNMLVV
jgi:hypothetical protein